MQSLDSPSAELIPRPDTTGPGSWGLDAGKSGADPGRGTAGDNYACRPGNHLPRALTSLLLKLESWTLIIRGSDGFE